MLLPLALASLWALPISPTPQASVLPAKAKPVVVLNATLHGSFDVKMTPLPPPGPQGPWAPGRFALDKQFHGELEATSQGEMMGHRTEVAGSAGYVAMERVSGTVRGRKGTFILQHSGTMNGGEQQLTITVIPDSGTGELLGLRGSMTITITGGKHEFDFAYSLPEKP